MVATAGDYVWSSYRQRMGWGECWIELDRNYLGLAESETERRGRYREFVEQGMSEKELDLLRAAVHRGHLTGSRRFVDEVEQILGRRIEPRPRGRPSGARGNGK